MTTASAPPHRAFAVWWKDFDRWSVGALRAPSWHWPREQIKPLSFALQRRSEPVDKKTFELRSEHIVTLRFTGGIEPRDLHGKTNFKGGLFFARAGDIVYSKIDVRNGAIGIVPAAMPVIAVTSEFPVYRIRPGAALPEYVQLVFQTANFRRIINGMVSGTSGRKRVQPDDLERVEIPLPPLAEQTAIVACWRQALAPVEQAETDLFASSRELDKTLHALTNFQPFGTPVLVLRWRDFARWDAKSARAAAFRLANPSFIPLSHFAEEATEPVKPSAEPEKEWPVYGVNNHDGVFFSHVQKGADFNAPYKRIRKDWFFHNPTRSSVGSLGIVPEVPPDAITSPEYQVWRMRAGSEWGPEFVAALVRTSWFVKLIQVHRVGAVKQRLYVENLLEMPMPRLSKAVRQHAAATRRAALQKLMAAREAVEPAKARIEAMILGNEKAH